MKYLIPALLLSLNVVAEPALRDDGKQVELLPDGTWKYISEDVLATSASGLRVRLIDDGSWEPIYDKAEQSVTKLEGQRTAEFEDKAALNSIEIQKVKQSRANSKSTVFAHNMLARVRFSDEVAATSLVPENFSMQDSKGNTYPVINVGRLGGDVLVRAEGAPDRWSRTKYIQLTISDNVLSTLAPIKLSVDFRDIKTKILTEFSDS